MASSPLFRHFARVSTFNYYCKGWGRRNCKASINDSVGSWRHPEISNNYEYFMPVPRNFVLYCSVLCYRGRCKNSISKKNCSARPNHQNQMWGNPGGLSSLGNAFKRSKFGCSPVTGRKYYRGEHWKSETWTQWELLFLTYRRRESQWWGKLYMYRIKTIEQFYPWSWL